MKIKLEKSGRNVVVALPAEVISRLGWQVGDICESSVESGELRLVRIKTKHDRTMEIAKRVMDEYREAFQKLAKS